MIGNVMNIAKTSIALLLATICAALCQTPLPSLPPDGFVTLEQIVNDFANSADSAFQKYNGMRVCVYGRVGKVTQSDDTEGDPLTVYMQLPIRTIFSPPLWAFRVMIRAPHYITATGAETSSGPALSW